MKPAQVEKKQLELRSCRDTRLIILVICCRLECGLAWGLLGVTFWGSTLLGPLHPRNLPGSQYKDLRRILFSWLCLVKGKVNTVNYAQSLFCNEGQWKDLVRAQLENFSQLGKEVFPRPSFFFSSLRGSTNIVKRGQGFKKIDSKCCIREGSRRQKN